MTAPPAAGLSVGALGCTRDGYRLIGVARLAWVLMSLVFVVPPDAVLLYRLYELASFPLGLVVHVLLPIGFCALALAPAGPLWRWVRNLAVALLWSTSPRRSSAASRRSRTTRSWRRCWAG